MTGQILSLFSFSRPKICDWSQQELSEFYRVEHALVQSGMRVETDRGLSDEGDPWFVFCRQEDGEVIVHFARLDGRYIVSSPSYSGISTGNDFSQLVRDLMSRHPLVHSGRRTSTSNVFLHPTALLIALVATAFFKSGEASAHDSDEHDSAGRDQRHPSASSGSLPLLGGSHQVKVTLEASHVAIVISAAIFAITSQNDVTASSVNEALSITSHFEAEPELLAKNASSVALASAKTDFGSASENVAISHAMEMGQNDVLKLLGVVAVLADLAPMALPEQFGGSEFETHSAHDEIAFRSIEDPVVSQHASHQGTHIHHGSDVVLELVKGSGEFPAVKSMETPSVGKVQSFEIVQVLPQVLQPFLAESLHVTVHQTSNEVLLALNIDSADLPTAHTPNAEGVATAITIAGTTNPTAADLSGPQLGEYDKGSVVELIEQFINHTPDYKVLVADHNIIFYDVHAMDEGDKTLKSMTWDFADGLSISLVAPSSSFHPELFA